MQRFLPRLVTGSVASAAANAGSNQALPRANAEARVDTQPAVEEGWESVISKSRGPFGKDELESLLDSLYEDEPGQILPRGAAQAAAAAVMVEDITGHAEAGPSSSAGGLPTPSPSAATHPRIESPPPSAEHRFASPESEFDAGSESGDRVITAAEHAALPPLPTPRITAFPAVTFELSSRDAALLADVATAMSEDPRLIDAMMDNPRLRAWIDNLGSGGPPLLTAAGEGADLPPPYPGQGGFASGARPRTQPREKDAIDQAVGHALGFLKIVGGAVVDGGKFISGWARDRAQEATGFLKDRGEDVGAKIVGGLASLLEDIHDVFVGEPVMTREEEEEEANEPAAGRRRRPVLPRPLVAVGVFVVTLLLLRRFGFRPRIRIV